MTGAGVVFKLAPSGTDWIYSVLYAFPGGAAGTDPSGTVAVDNAGHVYGTTFLGGKYDRDVAFEIIP